MIRKPLSESLEKLRRAQRALIRRKRGSKVRVSFSHRQPAVGTQRRQRSAEKGPAPIRPPRADPPWISRPQAQHNDLSRHRAGNTAPPATVECYLPENGVKDMQQASHKRILTPYPMQQVDGCCNDSFDSTKEHRYWGTVQPPPVSAPSNAVPYARPPPVPPKNQIRPPRQAVGYPAPTKRNGQHRRSSRPLGRPHKAARPARDKRPDKTPPVRTPVAIAYDKEQGPTPNSKRFGLSDPEV